MKTKINYESIVLDAINNSRRPLNILDIQRATRFTRVTCKKYADKNVIAGLIDVNKTSYAVWYSKIHKESSNEKRTTADV